MISLFSTRERTLSLACDVDSPAFDVPAVDSYEAVSGARYLDVSARKIYGKQQIELFVLNRHLTAPLAAKVGLQGAIAHKDVTAQVLNGDDLNEWNSFAEPDRVSIHKLSGKMEGNFLQWTFEPHSLTRITIETAN
jgi:alpha-L-arabinofuranosidase